MKQNLPLKSCLLAAALSLGGILPVRADDSQPTRLPTSAPPEQTTILPSSTAGDLGLLGQSFATLSYTRINLDDTPVDIDRGTFEVNQPLAFGLDGVFAYNYARSGAFAGSRLKEQSLTAALRAFSNSFNWGRPYLEAGIGQAWTRFAGASDKSILWEAAAGAEFQVLERATVTPYVQYVDTPDMAAEGVWNFGVKGSYWLDRNWAVTAGFSRDDEQNSGFTVGTNFRF